MSSRDNKVSPTAKATPFSETVRPFVSRGWDRAAFLPGIPGTKRPGRHTRKGWVGLKGAGLLKDGLSAAAEPTAWDDLQAWPTDTLCVRGALYPSLDVDTEDERVVDQVRMALPGMTWERGRTGSNRVLLPFRADGEVRPWPRIEVTMPWDPVGAPHHVIELNGAGKQWVAAGAHPKGGRYVWRDQVGDGPPPAADELQPIDQAAADEYRVRLVIRLRQAGATFHNGSDTVDPPRTGDHDRVTTDDRDPVLPPELVERVLLEIPDNRETVGGWDEAIPLLASIRYVLGREGAALPEFVEAWACGFESTGPEWIEGRWASFDQGVEAREGTFLQWVATHGSAELVEAVQGHVDTERTLAAFSAIEEDDEDEEEDDDGPQQGAEPRLDRSPNEAEAAAFILQATPLRGILGWCLFRHQMVLRRPIPAPDGKIPNDWTERPWTDADDLALLIWCQANGAPRMKKGVAQDAAMIVAQRFPFHPVREYLRSVRWDGRQRLDGWLPGYAQAQGDPRYLGAVGRATLISMVARVMEPGCKVDTVLVLEGEQGIGKSTLFQAMVPAPTWFSDSMPHDLASKDARAHLKGKWIIELPELAQFRRTELAALKGFITTASDTYRRSYGVHEETYERQCVFVASTNEDQYLADATGGRRYWPVALGGKVDLDGLRRDRDQLWAEAVHAFGRGEAWWITDESVLPLVQAEQASRRAEEAWDQIIEDYIAVKGVDRIVPTDLLVDVIGMARADIKQPHQKTVGDILRKRGWKKQAIRFEGGLQRKGWVAPTVVALRVVADEGGRDPDLIEQPERSAEQVGKAGKRDHLKVVRPPDATSL